MGERLEGEAFARALHTFKRTAFRWESQGVYREPDERDPFRQFLAGEQPDTTFMRKWLSDVRQVTQAGGRYSRVRLLTDPLTDYLRFELAITPHNVEAGEDIRVLPATRAAELAVSDTDFWLLDDEWAAVMHFDDNGLRYADVVDDRVKVREFLEIRDRVWDDAIPFEVYAMT